MARRMRGAAVAAACLAVAGTLAMSGQGRSVAAGEPRLLGLLDPGAPCQGDSGGPLVGFSPSGPRLVGVASTVGGKRPRGFAWVRCGLQGQGTVYTRASAFLAFVQGA
ncbi:MAG: trypsin-like serine protease [Solirubrobacterales bacterium]